MSCLKNMCVRYIIVDKKKVDNFMWQQKNSEKVTELIFFLDNLKWQQNYEQK